MKAAIAILTLAACGHAAPPAGHEVSNKPAPADAQVEAAADVDAGDDTTDASEDCEGDDESGQDCTSDTSITMHTQGKDADAHIETCVEREGEQHGEDFTTHDATATLVIGHGGEDHDTEQLAEWEKGGEEGANFNIVGVLVAPKGGDDVVLVETQSYAAMEGLHGVNAALVAYVDHDGAIKEVYTLEANLIDVQVSKDHRFATVATCVPTDKDGDAGTGGGACDEGAAHYDGDGKKLQLRWDGHAVKVIAVKH